MRALLTVDGLRVDQLGFNGDTALGLAAKKRGSKVQLYQKIKDRLLEIAAKARAAGAIAP